MLSFRYNLVLVTGESRDIRGGLPNMIIYKIHSSNINEYQIHIDMKHNKKMWLF